MEMWKKVLKKADVIIESDYETPAQETRLSATGSPVYLILTRRGRVTVIVSGQWVHEDQEQIAHALKIPEEKSTDHLSSYRRRIRRA